jgi:hypothetical protein
MEEKRGQSERERREIRPATGWTGPRNPLAAWEADSEDHQQNHHQQKEAGRSARTGSDQGQGRNKRGGFQRSARIACQAWRMSWSSRSIE